MERTIGVLLVNPITLWCNVMAAVLEDESDMEVVGSTTSAREAYNLAPSADVMLVNTRMADGAALTLIRAITGAGLPTKVLALGLTESKEQILQYIEAGACGYVLKDDSVDDLLDRIRDAYEGTVRASPRMAAAFMARVTEYAQLLDGVQAGVGSIADLTPREQEILELVGQNLTNPQIADYLYIEVGTVKNHIHSILRKLDADNRQEAAATWAIVKTRASSPN
jgi:DNA-binding NarL/FixJ family response regulator